MKITKWKKIITFLCVIALLAGTVLSPARIYAGDTAQSTTSSETTESTQTASENTNEAGSDLVDTGTASGPESETSGSAPSEDQAEQSSASGADTEASTSTTESGSGEPGTTEPESQNARNTATNTTATASSERSSSSVPSAAAKQAPAVNALAASNSNATVTGINLAGQYTASDGSTKDYITGYQLAYQDGNDWVTIPPTDTTTTVSTYTTLQMKVSFGGVSAQELYDNGGVLYFDVPELLSNPAVSNGNVTDANGKAAGTITVSGQRISLNIATSYLKERLDEEKHDFTLENGSFIFTAKADPSKIGTDYTKTIKIGPLDVTIRFDPDSDAKSGTLSLVKSPPSYSEDSDGSYLTYTLTVTAGAVEMPSVTVVDHFTGNANFVDSFVGVSAIAFTLNSTESTSNPYETSTLSGYQPGNVKLSSAKTATDPGTLLWTIGDMQPNEVRTLHYRVKLSSDYVGNAVAWKGVITNTATPYSKDYAHNAVTSSFTPHAGATATKKAGDPKENKDSTITIPYTITVTADSNNTWTIKNLKISDYLGADRNTQNVDKTILWDAITPTKTLTNLGFHDFTIKSDDSTISVPEGTSSSSAPYYALKGKNEYPGFNLYIGDIAPGKTVTITVNLTMKPIFTSAQVTLGNRASVYSNEQSSIGNQPLAGGSTQTSFDKQHWDRKILGSAIEKAIEQAPDSGANVYSYTNSAWSKSTTASAITVPAGSYQYQVVVNEQAIWDVSSAQFNDTLADEGKYLNYAGYLRLDYYADGVSSTVSNGSDTDVAKALEAKTPTKTAWLNIDGMKSFSLSPKDLESTFGKGAFLLTYYAKPVTGAFSSVKTGNSFTLRGTIVGKGETSYTLPAMKVNTNVTVIGTQDYSAHKYAWYYDANDTSDDFANGKLYWLIEVDGTKISSGMQLQDIPGDQPNHNTENSIVGIYFGNTLTADDSFTEMYPSYAEMKADTSFKKLDTFNYSWSIDTRFTSTSSAGILTFNNDIDIPTGKTMYIVLATYPNSKPSGDARTQTSYVNKLQERSNASLAWNDVNTATLYVLGQGTNFKEFGEYGTYNATTGTWSDIKVAVNHNINRILKTYTTNDGTQTLISGTYVDYILIVNYAGDESGTFKVEDVVPNGMEPVYVRYFWIPDGLRSNTNAPTMPEISSSDLGSGDWKDIGVKNTAIDNNSYSNTAYAYYDSASRRIVFYAGNLQKGTVGQTDQKDLQVQIVMRVTDPETIMGKEKSYRNTMNVYTTGDTLVSTSSVDTKVTSHTIDKTSGDANNGTVPYTITVNPMNLDLMPDSDTLTLVDELSYSTEGGSFGAMTLDPSSVKVQDGSGQEIDSSLWTLSITKDTAKKKNIMTMTVPDGQKLTITYNASIDASPGTNVKYTNIAHWYGFSEDKYNKVEKSVSYAVNASFGFLDYPVINLTKADQNNVTTTLSGAKFAIYKAVFSDGAWKKTGDAIETGTTGSNGTLSFGSGATKLQFNTVYAIEETEAPAGYVTDTTPTFIAMARADKSGAYPNESADWNSTVDSNLVTHTASDLAGWVNQGVTVNYKGSTYTYTAYNQKAKLKVNKIFNDSDGNKLSTPPDGTFLFGLYNSANTLVETLMITYSGGTATYQLTENGNTKSIDSPVFEDLNVNNTYSIYELDGSGDRVKNGRILYNKEGNGYTVTYKNDQSNDNPNTIVVQDSKTAPTVTVTNQKFTIPNTGISPAHNAVYIGAVILLGTLLAGTFWFRRRKRSRRPKP